MNKKQKILLRGIFAIVLIALVALIAYYLIYYRPNKAELVKISKDFIEKRTCMIVIPEEIREEEFDSEKVQSFIDGARAELSKYYSEEGSCLEDEMNGLIEYYKSNFVDGNEMVIGRESNAYQIDKVSLSMNDAMVKVRVKTKDELEVYGVSTSKSLYTIAYVKENGQWKVVSKEYEPVIE